MVDGAAVWNETSGFPVKRMVGEREACELLGQVKIRVWIYFQRTTKQQQSTIQAVKKGVK